MLFSLVDRLGNDEEKPMEVAMNNFSGRPAAFLEHITQMEGELAAHYTDLSKKMRIPLESRLNSTQILMLLRMPEGGCPARALYQRPVYAGTNGNYNITALMRMGYLTKTKSQGDRRSVIIGLTEKGIEVRRMFEKTFQ